MINSFLRLRHLSYNSIYNLIQEHSLPLFQDMIDRDLISGKHLQKNKFKIIQYPETLIKMIIQKYVRLLNLSL
jgi:hypothetical protein